MQRRDVLCGLVTLPFGCSLFERGETSHPEPQASAPAYTMSMQLAHDGHLSWDSLITYWTETMWAVKYDTVPFLRAYAALPARKTKPRLGMMFVDQPEMDIGPHAWVILDKRGQSTSVSGDAAVAVVADNTPIPADDIRIAGYAMHQVPAQMWFTNKFSDLVRTAVDTLLHEYRVGWPEAIASGRATQAQLDRVVPDYELALRICARYHDTIQQARAEIAMVTVLATQFLEEGAIDELEAVADEVIAEGRYVRPYPKPSDFGHIDNPAGVAHFQQQAFDNAWRRTHPTPLQYIGGLVSKVPATAGTTPLPAASSSSALVGDPERTHAPALGKSEADLKAAGIGAASDFVGTLPAASGLLDDYQQAQATANTIADGANAIKSGDLAGAARVAGKFLPADHMVGASLQTLDAARRGDIRGVIAGLRDVTKNNKLLARVRKRLSRFEKVKPLVEAGADAAKAIAR